jgi:hypothetical protein
MADVTRSLDVSDIQVIVEFPDDEGGMFWHHRLAMLRVSPGRWVMLTPDYDLEIVDLNTQSHRVVGRNTPFPRAQAAYVYAFDPISSSEIKRQKKLARGYQALLGDGAIDEVERAEWVVCDPSDDYFGKSVPQDIMDDEDAAIEFNTKGVVDWDGELRFVESVDSKKIADYVKARRTSDLDCRIRPVTRDSSGNRTKRLREVVGELSEEKMADWPHLGPRAALEFITAVSESAESWTLYHSEWERASGISTGSTLCHEHRILCDAMRLFCSLDQLNAPNIAGIELLIRRLIQIEMAVDRSARAPDFTGLATVLAGPTTESGSAVTKNFTEWIAGRQRDRAQVMKQERIFREESKQDLNCKTSSGGASDGAAKGGGGRTGGGRGEGRGTGGRGGRGAGRGRGEAASSPAGGEGP